MPTVVEFMGNAFRNEIGVTNPLQRRDEIEACEADRNSPEVDALALQAGSQIPEQHQSAGADSGVHGLTRRRGVSVDRLRELPYASLPGPGARQPVNLYSDFLLHQHGAGARRLIPQGAAAGDEWRTMPLWRVSERAKFLHDGRATSLSAAILTHDGQGRRCERRIRYARSSDQQTLIAFLGCL